jgi:hypothetical protein
MRDRSLEPHRAGGHSPRGARGSGRTTAEATLYERLGGIYAIAGVVDHFSDSLRRGEAQPPLRETTRAGYRAVLESWVLPYSVARIRLRDFEDRPPRPALRRPSRPRRAGSLPLVGSVGGLTATLVKAALAEVMRRNQRSTTAPLPTCYFSSGRADSNRRPLDPQSSALTKLRHGPQSNRSRSMSTLRS